MQSLDPAALQMLGRQHSAEQAVAALETARAIFPRLSFDLIYARPGQPMEAWREELRRGARPRRRSPVALPAHHRARHEVRGDAPAGRDRAAGRGQRRALYQATEEEAARFGLSAYEVSNYARPGGESRHNLTYWRYGDYAGIGPGAHGRITLGRRLVATRRHRAPEPWAERVERDGHGTAQEAALEPVERAREMLLMGLRLAEGIERSRFAARTGGALDAALDQGVLAQAIAEDYLAWRGERLVATPAGRLRLDSLLAAIVC